MCAYQDGIHEHRAPDRVGRWLQQFPEADRTAIAEELVHVLEHTFVSRGRVVHSIQRWLREPGAVTAGLIDDWSDATFLEVQTAGGSQHCLLDLIDGEAKKVGLGSVRRLRGTRLFAYVDDLAVHGMRVMNDLTPWLTSRAPARFTLLVLLQTSLSDRKRWVSDQIVSRAKAAGKSAQVLWWCESTFARGDCYRPTELPNDPELAEYLATGGDRAGSSLGRRRWPVLQFVRVTATSRVGLSVRRSAYSRLQ